MMSDHIQIIMSTASSITSRITFRNDTCVILNVALEHLGPVYHKNHVIPGEVVIFENVIKFWYTIHVNICDSPSSKFRKMQNVQNFINYVVPFVNPVNGMIRIVTHFMGKLWEEPKNSIESNGWLMAHERSFLITGGPSKDQIKNTTNFTEWIDCNSSTSSSSSSLSSNDRLQTSSASHLRIVEVKQ